MASFPVMFTLRDPISGNGYLAGVTISGRAIMREEDEQWWIHGVCPSGISATGSTPEEAFLRFRESYKYVLFDLSEDLESFESFQGEVYSLFRQHNEIEEECWETAFKNMRDGNVPTDGYFSTLPTQAPENHPTLYKVERLDQPESKLKSADNIADFVALPIAA